MRENKKFGPLFILIAAILWSFGGVCVKLIPWSGISISAVRGLIACIVIGLYRKSFRVHITKAVMLVALCTMFTTVLFMMANKLTTSANAIVLQYTAPAFIILFSYLFLKQHPKKTDILAVIGTLIGVSLFFIDQMSTGKYLGDLLAIGSGICFAGVFFANKLPGANPIDSAFLGNMMSILLLPFLFFDKAIPTTDLQTVLVILFMGIVQLGMGYIFFSIGIKHSSAITSSIIATMEPILNPIWVFLMIGEFPKPLSLVGCAIVLMTIVTYNVITTKSNYRASLST